MGFCYGERTVDVGQTMGLKAPLVWVTPSTSINNYEPKAQDRGHVQKLCLGVATRKSGTGKEWEVKLFHTSEEGVDQGTHGSRTSPTIHEIVRIYGSTL